MGLWLHSICGLHSCGRFPTRWWAVWAGAPTQIVYFSPESVGHQTESAQLFLDIPYHSTCKGKHFNDHYHPVRMSAWDNEVSRYRCICLLIQRNPLLVLLLHASPCFDITAPLKETNLLPRLRSRLMCWESRPRPDPQWSVRNWPVLVPAPLHLFLPFIHPFDVETIPQWAAGNPPPLLSVERHPSLALSSHFCETCNSAQDKYKMHLNLSGACKMTGGQPGEGNTLTGKMFPPWRPGTRQRGSTGSISVPEQSNWTGPCFPILTKSTRLN